MVCVLARKVGGKRQQLCKDGCALCCAVMSSAAALSTSYMWLLFFCFVFWHLSNAAFVIAWSSGGKKIGAKEYFCISAVVHPYLLLIYRFCFPPRYLWCAANSAVHMLWYAHICVANEPPCIFVLRSFL